MLRITSDFGGHQVVELTLKDWQSANDLMILLRREKIAYVVRFEPESEKWVFTVHGIEVVQESP